MEGMIRVAIIHRKRLFREGLAFALSQQQGIAVVSSAAEAYEVLDEIPRLLPDVIIIALSLPERDGLDDLRWIRNTFPDVAKVLMIGLSELASDVLACIEAGAVGYLPQEASLEDLIHSVRAVAAGEVLCSPKVAGVLFNCIAQRARERERLQALNLTHLTRREREVIALIEEGLSNKEIAVRLQIELQTAKNHVHNILEKLQLDSRREVARYAREHGLVQGWL
jgi:two-component system nitrate/nitrite response regulator NarL